MHERFKSRLKILEQERAQQSQLSFVIAFSFVRPDGTPTDATVAKGPRDFISRRREGETLTDFQERATAECQAAHPFGMPSVLFFSGEPKQGPNAA
jgi:hypothetical protein